MFARIDTFTLFSTVFNANGFNLVNFNIEKFRIFKIFSSA